MSYFMQKKSALKRLFRGSVVLKQDLCSLDQLCISYKVTISTTSPLIPQETSASDADFRSLELLRQNVAASRQNGG